MEEEVNDDQLPRPYMVRVDKSEYAQGSVICHESRMETISISESNRRFVAYSKKMNKHGLLNP